MTLTAFSTGVESACILTDTFSYGPNIRHTGHTTKVLTLPHLDAVLLGRGDGHFTDVAQVAIRSLSNEAETFDDLITTAHEEVRELWQGIEKRATFSKPTLFLIGYSDRVGRFTSWALTAYDEFAAAHPLTGLHIWPTPEPWQPTFPEDRAIAEDFGPEALQEWLANTQPGLGQVHLIGLDDWRTIGLMARQSRACTRHYGGNVPIGGDLHLTRLTRGSVSTEKLLSFTDDGEEFATMVAGSLHPVAQRGPCPCGSEKVALNCCLGKVLDDPCPCESGKTLRECCMVERDEQPADAETAG